MTIDPAVAYFSHLTSLYDRRRAAVVCVTHLVDTALSFLPAIAHLADLALVLPKPSSAQQDVRQTIEREYRVATLTRALASDADKLLAVVDSVFSGGQPVCIMDVGGYFAGTLDAIAERYAPSLAGIVEGTENGLQKYEELRSLPVPVYSVARSPLKYPENHLVGAGIAFSVEAVLREQGEVMPGLRGAVIGYGRIGRAVAHALRGRDVEVSIADRDPIALAEAAAHGFRIVRSTRDAVTQAGLVVCATGQTALRELDFDHVCQDAYIASVTSADDELDLPGLCSRYVAAPIGRHVTQYRRNRHSIRLINGGNAVNFLHGGVLGAAIHLVEGEKLACLNAVLSRSSPGGIHELTRDARLPVAETWLRHFGPS